MHLRNRPGRWIAAALLLPLLAACGDEAPQGPSAGGGGPPAVAVSTVTVAPESIPVTNELPGRIAPTSSAGVRPRVSGLIIERVFEQGTTVEQGDVLYRIDPAPYRVQVESAKATLHRAEAVQQQARQQAERQRELRERNVASAQQLDDAIAALAQADADVAAARAGLNAARLDLQYTEVKAPISGRIGRAHITEGTLVGPGDTRVLARIHQLDPIYADFTQSANELRQLRRDLASGELAPADLAPADLAPADLAPADLASSGASKPVVRLKFDDGSEYPHRGRLMFSEASVDATTGQITLRARFPNPEGNLLPGLYVRVVIEQGMRQNAIAVPQQAVQRDTAGRAQIYVVSDKGTVERRNVQTGDVVGRRWVIEEGLQAGEQVVVEGFQKISPGAKVRAQAWERPGDRAKDREVQASAGTSRQ